MTDRPFVYISSLRRTGSTVLAESLVDPPQSYIFREPHLGLNSFTCVRLDRDLLAGHGVDVTPLHGKRRKARIRRGLHIDQGYMMRAFVREVLPQLNEKFGQVGVKEIRNEGWPQYRTHIPNIVALITGRDPRDVYLSLAGRMAAGTGRWEGEFTPGRVADNLMSEFRWQQRIMAEVDHLAVSYEQLCLQPEATYGKVRAFVESPLRDLGQIGSFNASNKARQDEFELHGTDITDKRVGRWRRETEDVLLADAHRTFDAMGDYVEFWGYER